MKKVILAMAMVVMLIFTSNAFAVDWGVAYTPFQNSTQRTWSVGKMSDLGSDYIRLDVHWDEIEATEGTYDWSKLDAQMDAINNAGLNVLVTVQMMGPDWACDPNQTSDYACVYLDNADFNTFIRTMLQRYSNEFEGIQYGNEWNREESWVGTVQNFRYLVNSMNYYVDTYSPQTTHYLGSVSKMTPALMLACETNPRLTEVTLRSGVTLDSTDLAYICSQQEYQDIIDRDEWIFANSDYDGVDLHLYDDPDKWDLYITKIRELSTEPLIVSEFGGPNLNWVNPISEAYQDACLEDYLDEITDNGYVTKAYMFKMVQGGSTPHSESALINNDANYTERDAFGTYEDWIFNN